MTQNIQVQSKGGGLLADDILHGADEIAQFLGITRRSVYYHAELNQLPVFRLGNQLKARKSTLVQHIAQLEGRHVAEGVASTSGL